MSESISPERLAELEAKTVCPTCNSTLSERIRFAKEKTQLAKAEITLLKSVIRQYIKQNHLRPVNSNVGRLLGHIETMKGY
jgi:hypothetical protein